MYDSGVFMIHNNRLKVIPVRRGNKWENQHLVIEVKSLVFFSHKWYLGSVNSAIVCLSMGKIRQWSNKEYTSRKYFEWTTKLMDYIRRLPQMNAKFSGENESIEKMFYSINYRCMPAIGTGIWFCMQKGTMSSCLAHHPYDIQNAKKKGCDETLQNAYSESACYRWGSIKN